MSDLLFTCLKCSKHLAIDVKGCGSTIKCPDCDAPVNVPFAKVFFKCQACRSDLCAPNGIGGKDYTCPSCGNKVAIPQSAETSKIQDKRICPKCGHSNATESTFCAECGITLNSRISPATDKRCPKCEVIISPSDAIFCANCGMSFNAVTNPSTYTPAPNRLLKVKPAESNIREKSLYYKTAYGMAPEACDKKCPYCSNRLPSDAVVCVNCGIDLRSGKKLKMQRPEPKSDFDPLPYIKVGAICLALWGCYAGYQAYKGSSGNGGSSSSSVAKNDITDKGLREAASDYRHQILRGSSTTSWTDNDFYYLLKATKELAGEKRGNEFLQDFAVWEEMMSGNSMPSGFTPTRMMNGDESHFNSMLSGIILNPGNRLPWTPADHLLDQAFNVMKRMTELGWRKPDTANTANVAAQNNQTSQPNTTSQTDRYYEKNGGFSYMPPAEWGLKRYKGQKYLSLAKRTPDGFTCSISFYDSKVIDSWENTKKGWIAEMQQTYPNLTVKSIGERETTDGALVIKYVSEIPGKDGRNYLLDYLVRQGNVQFSIMLQSLVAYGPGIEAEVDDCVKSFRFE